MGQKYWSYHTILPVLLYVCRIYRYGPIFQPSLMMMVCQHTIDDGMDIMIVMFWYTRSTSQATENKARRNFKGHNDKRHRAAINFHGMVPGTWYSLYNVTTDTYILDYRYRYGIPVSIFAHLSLMCGYQVPAVVEHRSW